MVFFFFFLLSVLCGLYRIHSDEDCRFPTHVILAEGTLHTISLEFVLIYTIQMPHLPVFVLRLEYSLGLTENFSSQGGVNTGVLQGIQSRLTPMKVVITED